MSFSRSVSYLTKIVFKKNIFVKCDTDCENHIHFCFFYDTGRLQVLEKVQIRPQADILTDILDQFDPAMIS